MIQSFNRLQPGNLNLEQIGLKRLLSTWTYLVNDDPFEKKQPTQTIQNIGFALAAGISEPLLILKCFLDRFRPQK